MSLLGWVVGAAILDEWGRCEEQERELEERDRRIRELEGRISRLEATRGRDVPAPWESDRPWQRKGRWGEEYEARATARGSRSA